MPDSKRILITGGDGFLATHLKAHLRQHDVSAPNRHELDVLATADVGVYLQAHAFDIVIHAATYDAAPLHSRRDPLRVLENNLRMFFNITRFSHTLDKIIYFGSGAEFDRDHWVPTMDESYFDCYVPRDQYGFSKYVMTQSTLDSSNIYNLRLFATFGEYEDWRVRFISNVCANAAHGRPILIRRNAFYDFMDVADLMRVVDHFIENTPARRVYNVCSGKTQELAAIAEKVRKLSGSSQGIITAETGLNREYSGDNSRLLEELGGFEFTDFDTSLERLFEWYACNPHLVDPSLL